MLTQFQNVKVGQEFFDPDCGESFVKICENAAEMVKPNGDIFYGLMQFDDAEEVEI